MAVTSVVLDIRANTTRALNEFKKFSSQLDNKFLVSGLKLDVVRSALGQINREFQKAIGEQGLQAGQSLRAAQNQAALLLGTFKGVGAEASLAITTQFSEAFNQIAVNAGATSKDVQKALSATPFISTNLSEDLRKELGEGFIKFQVDARRAGLGDDYANIIKQFLAGEVDAGDLANSTDALRSRIGVELSNLGGTRGRLMSAEQRSQIVRQLQSGRLGQELTQLAERADWGFSIIEQLNASLFNPEKGVFGTLRQVTMAVGDKTNIFQETRVLIDSVFGRQGFFVNFFKQITKIFGIEDPLKIVINGIRWLTRQFERLTKFLESPMVQQVVDLAQKVISGVVSFFTDLYNRVSGYLQSQEGQQLTARVTTFFTDLFKSIGEFYKSEQGQQIRAYAQRAVDNVKNLFKAIDDTVKAGDWDPSRIQAAIEQIGTDVRSFIRNVGKSFRELDIKQQGNFILEIIGTLVEEIARTIGAVISEGIQLIFSERGLSVLAGLIEVINKGLTAFFSEIFGEGTGSIFGAIATAGIVLAFGKKILAGILAFGAKLIGALPGGQTFNALIKRRVTAALDTLGKGIAGAILGGRGRGRQTPGSPAELGNNQAFYRQVIFYLGKITACVCNPLRSSASGISPGPSRPLLPGVSPGPSRPKPPRFLPEGIDQTYVIDTPTGPVIDVSATTVGSSRPRPTSARPKPTPVPSPTGRRGGGGQRAALAGTLALTALAANRSEDPASGVVEGAAAGASMGMLFGPKGAIAGAILGGIASWIGDLSQAGDKTKAVLEPLNEAFDAIKETIGPTFSSLWSSVESIIFAVGNLINIFGTFSSETDSTQRSITALKVILTPVVAAFQLIEQTANILSIAFSGLEGATLLIRDVFSRINRFFGGGSSEKRRELEREQASWSERNEEKLNRPREAFERHTNSGRRRTRGRREAGGPVQRNQSYLVGERGPEIFTPQASGNIIPNINLGSLSNSIDSSVSQVAKFFRVSLTNLWNSAVSPAPGWISSSTSTISKTFTQIIPNAWKASSSGFSRSLSDSIRGFGQSIGVSLTQTTKRVDFGQEILRALITNIESLSRRETGGPVNRGRAYLVGERGPELFIPSGDGSIVSKMGLMGSGNRSSSSSQVSANFNVTIQVNGGLNAGNVESLRGPVLAIIQDAWKEASTGITSRGAII